MTVEKHKMLVEKIDTDHKYLRTEIIGQNEFGEVLFREENDTMLGGAIFILEKLFGVRSSLKVDSLNNIMGIANEHEDDLEGKLLGADNLVTLFGVGTGGAGDSPSDIKKVEVREREIFEMIPFRVVEADLPEAERGKYWFRKPTATGKTAYYLKRFEQDPSITTLWRDGEGDEDGSMVESGVHNSDRSDEIETLVDLTLKINKRDLREHFEEKGEIEMTRFNSIGLFSAQRKEMADGTIDYANVKLFSKLNISNENFILPKELTITYRIFTL